VWAVDADNSGLYRVLLRFEITAANAQAVAYKFKIERGAKTSTPGDVNDGWELGRNRQLALPEAGKTTTEQRAFNFEPGALPPQRTGRIDVIAPRPSKWVQPRTVQVWLPPGMPTAPGRRYPVLYLHDGQNVFDARAAGAEWQADETAQRLVLAGTVAPMIIVAVHSTAERTNDYTPVPATLPGSSAPVGGQGPRYARYLVDELKPFIDATYPTRPEREHTAVGGSSFGGLMSLGLLLHHGDTFGAGLVVSPSVWWADEVVLQQLDKAAQPSPPPRLWVDIGLLEGGHAVLGARRLRDRLRQHGWPHQYTEAPLGTHDEAAWAQRFEAMLRFLYAP
jgi:predicted alpha/beta superfamily hydrolase